MKGLLASIRRRLQHEIGVVHKDHGGRVRVCLVYPNTYSVGMSSLGFQTVYHLLNSDPGVVCERSFVPDSEDLAELERTGSPLVSYESQTPLSQFDVVAFSISYELDYLGVARVLRLARIPSMSQQRHEGHPLVLAGGAAVSINPRPPADILDAAVLGEGEEVVGELMEVMREAGEKTEALARINTLKGVWVPAIPDEAEIAPAAQRRYVRRLASWPTYSRVLTKDTEFGDLFLVEVSRGCGRACKFCVTPVCYWPLRWRSAESVLRSVREGLEHRKAIGLVGAAVSDHPEIDELATRVVGLGARLSVSSLRADSVSDTLLDALARSGARSITIAPEAGSERLRDAIGKGITDNQIFDTLRRATAAGIREAKLYFMVGLPGEMEADVEAIPKFVRQCMEATELRSVTVAAGAFVPKPGTPYEHEAMLPVQELSRRLRMIRDSLRRERRVRLALESANWSVVEGVLSQGDRRLAQVIVQAESGGGNLSAWREAMSNLQSEADGRGDWDYRASSEGRKAEGTS